MGDSGTAVRDIQDRLSALGYSCSPDPRSEYAESTASAVMAFQRRRGLPADGVVGSETWRAIYEAGFRLGDRLLYYRRPMLRGDDVAELQRRLNSLGFEAGKVDGIFGPIALRALLDFQQNRGMAEDGIAGPRTLAELDLVARATQKTGREAIREREWLRGLPHSVVGARVFLDPACRDTEEAARTWLVASETAAMLQEDGAIPILSRSSDTNLPERIRARRANRLGAALIVSFQLPHRRTTGCVLFRLVDESKRSRRSVGRGHRRTDRAAVRGTCPPDVERDSRPGRGSGHSGHERRSWQNGSFGDRWFLLLRPDRSRRPQTARPRSVGADLGTPTQNVT